MLTLEDRATGYYKNPDWAPSTPGLFAVIIGVSRYPHLIGGKSPANETYGFEQLATAAQTAYRVFRWLRERFELPGVPVATCRLLLSPTDGEERIAAADEADPKGRSRLVDISALPTLKNCVKAIHSWHDEMLQLDEAAGKQSRSLFVFCGHGLQSSDRPLLLPSDWLGPDEPNPNDAISTQNLVNGLSKVPVRQQWFFCDACRATTSDLDQFRNLSGRQILNETFGEKYERSYPIIYSSARGMPAFESSAEECTIFGGSLLDGLFARVPDIVEPTPRPARIAFGPLLDYVRRETHRRLEEHGEPGSGVVLTGQYLLDNPIVTHVKQNNVPPSDLLSRFRGAKPQARPLGRYRSHRFGSERWTDFFTQMIVRDVWASTDVQSPTALDVLRSDDEESDAEETKSFNYEMAVSLQRSESPRCIQLTDRRWGGRGEDSSFLFYVPPGVDSLHLTAAVSHVSGVRELDVFYGNNALFPGNAVTLERNDVSSLYRMYRTAEPIDAARVLASRESELVWAFKDKRVDPFVALEAALMLLRSGRFRALYGLGQRRRYRPFDDWLVNLAEWFPQMGSDACVLVAQRLVADPSGMRFEDAGIDQSIAAIRERSLPYTSEALNYLHGLGSIPVNLYPDRLSSLTRFFGEHRSAVELLVRRSFETRGLFAVYRADDRVSTEDIRSSWLLA